MMLEQFVHLLIIFLTPLATNAFQTPIFASTTTAGRLVNDDSKKDRTTTTTILEFPNNIFRKVIATTTTTKALEDGKSSGGSSNSVVQKGSFIFDNTYEITYKYKAASPGYEGKAPILLIHPVGIGLSNWFYDKLYNSAVDNGPAIYAINLLGCGQSDGSATWDPNKDKGMFIPLTWVQQCEEMIQSVILPNFRKVSPFNNFGKWNGVHVLAQGGLAPVAIVLTSRNKYNNIQSMILTSPPSWDDIIKPVPENELQYNYNFLCSNLGNIAFNLLETKWAVRFFSDLFLFDEKCNNEWLDNAMNEADVSVRSPVQLFNAGFCQHRSYQEELCDIISRPTLILQGKSDNRDRSNYEVEMKTCSLVTLQSGKNVLPWESPDETWNAITQFLKDFK